MKKQILLMTAVLMLPVLIQLRVFAEIVVIKKVSDNGVTTVYEGEREDSDIFIPWGTDGMKNIGFIFNWDNNDYYIVELQSSQLEDIQQRTIFTDTMNTQSVKSIQPNSFDVSVSLMRDNIYCERQLMADTSLGIQMILKNKETAPKTVSPYIAIYDNNVLTELKKVTYSNIAYNEVRTYNEVLLIDGENLDDKKVKIMLWDDDMTPLIEAIPIDSTYADFYGDTKETAHTIPVDTHYLEGGIDYPGDQDMFKFTPSATGTYIFSTIGSTDTYGTLYDGSQTISDDNTNGNYNFRITQTLSAGVTYYIEVKHSDAGTGPYKLYIEKPLTVTIQ